MRGLHDRCVYIPENAIDAFDAVSLANTFGSEKYMNTSSRRMQFGLKLFF